MTARYVQKGEAIDYRPTENVAAGDVIVLGTLVGIARLDIVANTLGSLAIVGCFEAPKATGEITAGAVVFWDATNSQVTTTATGNPYLGKAVATAAADDETVQFILNAPYVATATA